MSYNSKYSGQQVEALLDQVANGNAGGGGSGGGITTEIDPIFSASASAKITEENISSWNNKVDKVNGKQLSTEDFTTLLKQKLDGLSNYDDTEIQEAVSKLRTDFDTLVSGDTTTAIKTFNEVIAFLDGLEDTEDLASIIASIEQQIAAKQDKLVSGTNIKTINGVSILGSGNIVISSGSTSPLYPQRVHQMDDDNVTINAGEYHIWPGDMESLTISLNNPSGGYAPHWIFRFYSGATPTTLTLPDGLKWANGVEISISANKTYEVSITEGLAVWAEF